jgi:rRNA biogenesis protein RRP36
MLAVLQCCRVGKDPRFEALSGAFNADRFRKQYSFVFDEQLPAEKSSLRAAMKVRRPLRWMPSAVIQAAVPGAAAL